MLKKELERYLLYRTETFAARRAGGAVQSISAEADNTALLRFFGWMAATLRPLVGDSLEFMLRPDLGDIAQEYVQWLQSTQRCKFSTIANYMNGLVSITSYCYANLEPEESLLTMDPNPLTQLINLRGQAEKASKTQKMYENASVDGSNGKTFRRRGSPLPRSSMMRRREEARRLPSATCCETAVRSLCSR